MSNCTFQEGYASLPVAHMLIYMKYKTIHLDFLYFHIVAKLYVKNNWSADWHAKK